MEREKLITELLMLLILILFIGIVVVYSFDIDKEHCYLYIEETKKTLNLVEKINKQIEENTLRLENSKNNIYKLDLVWKEKIDNYLSSRIGDIQNSLKIKNE